MIMSPKFGPRKIGKAHAGSFFLRRKWAGDRRILTGGGAAFSPASACGAQVSPAARYPTPSGRTLGLSLHCRRRRCGQGISVCLCLAECLERLCITGVLSAAGSG